MFKYQRTLKAIEKIMFSLNSTFSSVNGIFSHKMPCSGTLKCLDYEEKNIETVRIHILIANEMVLEYSGYQFWYGLSVFNSTVFIPGHPNNCLLCITRLILVVMHSLQLSSKYGKTDVLIATLYIEGLYIIIIIYIKL